MTTTATDPSLVTGTLAELHDDGIVLTLSDSDYRIHLATKGRLDAAEGKRVTGRIHAEALRVDIAGSGGRFIEPVYGRPRRVQGRIVAADPDANTITVKAACPVVCELTHVNQTANDLPVGAIGTFDVRAGAKFELISAQPATAVDTIQSNPTPHDQSPTQGSQAPTAERVPGEKTTDAGKPETFGPVSGQREQGGDTPISGDESAQGNKPAGQ